MNLNLLVPAGVLIVIGAVTVLLYVRDFHRTIHASPLFIKLGRAFLALLCAAAAIAIAFMLRDWIFPVFHIH